MAVKENSKDDVLVKGTSKADSITNYGNKVTISAGKGNDTVNNEGGSNASINAGAGDDTISNDGSDVTISAGAGDDTIENGYYAVDDDYEEYVVGSYNVSIDAGAGNDEIVNRGFNVTINTGAGDDTIYNDGSNVTINGGTGNDYISNDGSNVIIDAGAGNDNIANFDGEEVWIVYSGGNDSVYGFGEDSTLEIASGKMNSVVTNDGNNYYLTVDNDTITLEGAAHLSKLNIYDSEGNAVNYQVKVDFNATDGNDTIRNYYLSDVSINSGKGNDYIHNSGSNVSIDAGAGNDTISIYTWNDAAQDVLIKYSGGNDYIDGFNEDDTLQIASGKMNSVVTTNGRDYFLTVGNNTITLEGASSLEAVNIVNSKGKAVKFKVKYKLNVTDGDDSVENYRDKVTIDAGKGNDDIYNYGSKVLISGGKGNDSIYNGSTGWRNRGGDSVTIDAGAGNDYIETHGDNVLFKYSGGNDLISGFNNSSSLQIASGKMDSVIHSDGSDYFLTVGKKTITLGSAARFNEINIVDSKGKAIKYNVETDYHFTEDNDSVTNRFSNVTLNALGGDDTITNYGSYVSILGGKGDDYLANASGSYSTIDGGKGDDYINLWISSYLSVNGGAGNDVIMYVQNNSTVNGGKGNDYIQIASYSDGSKIIGGKGNDTIINAEKSILSYTEGDGNDLITGFKANSTLQIGDSTGTYSTTKSGSDIIVSVGKGKITLEGANKISSVRINDDMILTDRTKATLKVGSAIKTIDASARTEAIQITGNSKANMIIGGSKNDTLIGGKGNDSLWGGFGNDSLVGGDGKDVFIYKPGEGTDRIFDYQSGDMLTILKADGTAGGSFKSSKFSGGDLTLAITGGGKVIFENVTASDKFNINGTTYKISGTKLVK